MKKRTFIITIGAVLLASLAIVIFMLRNGGITNVDFFTTGEAEAVAITIPEVFDGLWDTLRFLDELYYPIGIALNGGFLIVADSMADRIQIFSEDGNMRIGRPGQFGFSYYDSGAMLDGYRENALFTKPSGVFVTPNGEILVADTENHTIRRINDDFVITLAGNGRAGFANGIEGNAQFNSPRAAVMCDDGYIYVADTLNHVIRRIDHFGNVTTYAGLAQNSGFVDGDLTQARFFEPSGLYVTQDGVLYVADAANHSIRRIENGIVSTVAGQPGELDRFTGYYEGGFVDGTSDGARFNFPRDVAVLPNGYILVADSLNHAIRMITPEYTRTIVGSGAADMFHASVENLRLSRPEGIATDGETLFISDTINNRVLAIPLTERVLQGRPSRYEMLATSGLSADSRFPYRGDIRVFLGNERINFGQVHPWNSAESIFMPIRSLLEALGANVELDQRENRLYITIGDTITALTQDSDYFIMRGVAVTTLEEIMRLFPYTLEWFPELSLITMFIPYDLR